MNIRVSLRYIWYDSVNGTVSIPNRLKFHNRFLKYHSQDNQCTFSQSYLFRDALFSIFAIHNWLQSNVTCISQQISDLYCDESQRARSCNVSQIWHCVKGSCEKDVELKRRTAIKWLMDPSKFHYFENCLNFEVVMMKILKNIWLRNII